MMNPRPLINQLRVAYFNPNRSSTNVAGSKNTGMPVLPAYCAETSPIHDFGCNLYHNLTAGAVGYIPFVAAGSEFTWLQSAACSTEFPLRGDCRSATYCCFPNVVSKGKYLRLYDFTPYLRQGYRLNFNQARFLDGSWSVNDKINVHMNIAF